MMAMQTSQQSPRADDRSDTHQDLGAETPCHRIRAEVEDGEAGKVHAEDTPSLLSSIGGDSFRDNDLSSTLDTQRPQIVQQDGNYSVLMAHDNGTATSPVVPCCPNSFLSLQPAITEQQEQEHQQEQSVTQEGCAPGCQPSQRQQQPAHGPSSRLPDQFQLAESHRLQEQLPALAQLQSQQLSMPSIIMPQRRAQADSDDDDNNGQPHQPAEGQGCCCDTEFVESESSSSRGSSSSSSNSNPSHSGSKTVSLCPRSCSLALTGPGAALSRPSFFVARSLSSSSTSSTLSTSSSSSSLAPSTRSSSPRFSPSSAYSYISPALPSPLLYTRKRSVARTSFPFPSFSLSPPASTKDDPPRSLALPPSPTPHHKAARLRQKSVPNLSGSTLTPRPALSRSPSLSLLPFCGSLTSPNHGETTTSTTLSCAYPQPFLSVPSASPSENRLSPASRIANTSTSLLRNLDSLSAQISPDSDMTRQRSMSTSSLGTLAKSPSSLTASLSASVALYDSHQPPKTLQDILLLAQSHYISHRYVPALTLYRLAAEKHHSLPACCSLYALYTSTVKTPGLVRSDTKATEVLIHALRIWTARRWSSSLSSLDGNHSSMRSKTRDDHAELEEYFAHPRSASNQQRSGRSSAKNNNNSNGTGASIPISSRRDSAPRPIVAESIESEYRRPGLSHQEDGSASEDSESGSESGSDDEDADEDDDSEEEDCDSECEECQNCEGGCEHCEDSEEEEEDEEQAKEEEARRIGLATMEIEDIVQKLCSMIQKGVLGLDEAVVIEAISMVRKIERGLSKDTEAWQAQMAKSKSLFESSLSGGKTEGESGGSSSGTAAGLLLTQSIDLSFLNLTPESTSPMSQVRAVDLSSRKRAKATASISTPSKHPVNAAISRLSIGEQEADQAICRAMRIRIMFTLGWVHQQRGEYHWGAQAYGVCSEVIPPPGKRLLVSLQQQATVQKWTCLAFEKKAQEQQAQAEEERQRALAEQQQQKPERIPSPPASTQQQQQRRQPRKLPTSPSYTSSEVSTAAHHHADISSPSSYSSSESAAVSIRGGQTGTTISSLSAAMWSSGLFKSSTTPSEALIPTAPATTAAAMVGKPASPAGTLSSVQSDPTSKSSTSRQLHRSKSVSLGLKINTLNSHEVPQETKEKEPHHHQHHHPRAQHRAKGHHQHGQGAAAAAAAVAAAVLTMTMSDHQKKVVKCGHCGQKRILMPLCVCKKVRYCNRECRIADLEAHRKTGCHAALMSTSGGSTSSSGSGSAAAATAAAAAAAGLQVGPGMSM